MAIPGRNVGLVDVAGPLGGAAELGRTRKRDKAFTITELRRNGSGTYEPTPVKFVWDSASQSAPRPSWKFGLKQRTKRRDYAGADEPTEQILGPMFKPFTVDGTWDDRYAGVDFAWETHQAFEQLVARGNPVRIEFEDLGVTGIITDYDPEYRRRNYIHYAFSVSPHFRQPGGIARAQKPQVPVALSRPEALVSSIDSIAKDAVEVQDDLPTRLPTTSNTVSSVIDKVGSWLSKVEDAKQIVDNQLFGPIQQVTDSMKRLASQMRAIRGDVQDILTSVADVVSDTELAYTTAIDVLDFEVWKRGIAYQARLCVGASAESEGQLNERVDSQIKAVYRPHAGESLYAISNQFYNTPHNWRAIADVNGLTTITLQGDESLVIPELR